MTLLLLGVGRYSDTRMLRRAGRELAIYGPAQRAIGSPRFSLHYLGEALNVREAGAWRIAAAGPQEVDTDVALEMARGGRLAADGPGRWPHSIVAVWNADQSRLWLVRGEFCACPLNFVHEGSDLLVSAAHRAFRVLPHAARLASLKKGHTLIHDFASGKLDIRNGERTWVRDPMDACSYQQAQAGFRERLTGATRVALRSCPRPAVLSLSGGLDSAILARILDDLGERLPAFTVSLEAEGDELPSDLVRARLTARRLGLELHEIIIRKDEIDALIPDTILRADSSLPIAVEGHLYLTRLCGELERRGIASYFRGDGLDGLLGSYSHLAHTPSGWDRDRLLLQSLRQGYALEPAFLIMESFSPKSVAPFIGAEIEEFCLRLPRDYIVLGDGENFVGKRIARDAFAGDLPGEVIQGPKILPPVSTGLHRVISPGWGGRPRRRQRYFKLYSKIVLDPEAKRRPRGLSRLRRWFPWKKP